MPMSSDIFDNVMRAFFARAWRIAKSVSSKAESASSVAGDFESITYVDSILGKKKLIMIKKEQFTECCLAAPV